MALGGGTFTTQNKILPGAYINFASVSEANAELSDRGYAAIALQLPFSPEKKLFKVTRTEASSNCRRYFGFGWSDPEMLPVREIFKHAHTVYFFNVRSGGTASTCAYCTAKNPGKDGDSISVTVNKKGTKYNVVLSFGGTDIETHYGVTNLGDVKSDFVVWTLKNISTVYGGGNDGETVYLTGGSDGTVANTAFTAFLSAVERCSVNVVCIPASGSTVQLEAVEWCRKMRDERGKKLQIVLPQIDDYDPGYEGVIVADDTSAITDSAETLETEWVIGSFYQSNGNNYIYKHNGKPASVRVVGKIYTNGKRTLHVAVTSDTAHTIGIARFDSRGAYTGYSFYFPTKTNAVDIPLTGVHSFKLMMCVRALSGRAEITSAEDFVDAAGITLTLKSVESGIAGDGTENLAAVLTPWVAGVAAGMGVNESATNLLYDGELNIGVDETQEKLEELVQAGRFVFHIVDGSPRVLRDVNSLTDFTVSKSDDFSSNQTIRVLDQIANDIASLFGRYIGKVPNDAAGRISLWNDIVKHHRKLERLRAIEGFDEDDIVIQEGENKRSVVVYETVTPVNAMEQLYMTVRVQ